MRKYIYLGFDILCVCAALVAALYLRHGIPLIQEGQPKDLYLLLEVTAVTALVIFPLMRVHSGIWRHTSAAELTDIAIAVALIVLISNSALFLTSRLQMVPRSVPPMHWALAIAAMGGSRLLVRQLLGHQRLDHADLQTAKQHVLVIGACQTAELYLQFVRRIPGRPILVEGILDSNPALSQRMFQKHRILGTPQELPAILEQLRVHGIPIRHIVMAKLLREMPKEDKAQLVALRDAGVIELISFAKYLGPTAKQATLEVEDFYQQLNALPADSFAQPGGYYPYLKRALDMIGGLCLAFLLLPIMLLTALIVLLDVGFPLLFWQQRPGRYGKPFRLYKFRTMRAGGRRADEDRLSHKSGDAQRTSLVGKWLRRLRLDELPQLFHILYGTMSFVGPRPLLPDDQPSDGKLRLSIRPGITGWAQIHGGDALSPEEKLMYDLWYLHHMSLPLDVRIVLRTLSVIWREDSARRSSTAHPLPHRP